jgi:hypothetical protein
LFDIIPIDRSAADVRGLPPARAALARVVAWRRKEQDALATLKAGRARIAARIEAAKAEIAQDHAQAEAEAASILDSVRRGAEFALSFIRPREAVLDLTVAHLALAKADEEIRVKAAELDAVAERQKLAVDAALTEAAHSVVNAYDSALTAATEAAARLEGLAVHLGRGRAGRTVGEMPGFAMAGDDADARPVAVHRREIDAAAKVWRGFAEALANDPRADAAKHLRFMPLDPSAPTNLSYHELTAAERRLVDVRAANQAHI